MVTNLNFIKLDNINFDELEKIDVLAGRSRIYTECTNSTHLYKIFKDQKTTLMKEKQRKLELLKTKSLSNNIILPNIIIEDKDQMCGVIQNLIKGFELNEFYKMINEDTLFDILLSVSKDLAKMHGKGMVVGDMHFNNILVNKNNEHFFIDTDSYGVDNFKAEDIPYALANYCSLMNYSDSPNQNTDRLCLLLSIFQMYFERNILSFSEYTYDDKAEQSKYLYYLKDIFLDLKYSSNELMDVPYLHELVRR